MLPKGSIELEISGCRYHFRSFQLKLHNLGTKNFLIGSVGKKLQLFELGRIFKNSIFFHEKKLNAGTGMVQPFINLV